MGEFEIPESLDGYDANSLGELETQATEAFDELKADTDLDAAGLARLKKIAAFINDVRAKKAELQAEAERRQAEIDELDALVHQATTDDEDADGDGDTDGGEPAAVDDLDDVGEPAGEPEQVPAVVASIGRAAARQRKPEPRTKTGTRWDQQPAKVLAAANLPNKTYKSAFKDVHELTAQFNRQFSGFPAHTGQATRIKSPVAQIELPHDPAFVFGGRSREDDWDLLDQLGSQKRLSGGNVIASGGWCALNDRLWDLCPGLETTAGLWDLPGGTLRRPGVQYPGALPFADLYAGIGFHQVEADSIAGDPKPCYDVPCPTFPEQRMELDGMCIRQDIVANAMWPEWTRDVIRRAPIAHEHKINARLLAQAFANVSPTNPAGSTPYTLVLGGDIDNDETSTGVLGGLSIVATHIRYKNRTLPGYVVEGVGPLWFQDWIRADMARRKGVNFFDVTDAQIDAWFTRRKIRMQWVYDLQDGYVDAGGVGFGGTTAPQQWPASVTILLYPSGTYTKLTRPIIDLAAVYDSTGLEQNEYTAVFTEQATLLLKRCFDSYRVTIPLCPTGAGPADIVFDCSAA